VPASRDITHFHSVEIFFSDRQIGISRITEEMGADYSHDLSG